MKILAIGSHPDDVELACGGTIARAIMQGHKATMLVLANGYTNYKGETLRSNDAAREDAIASAEVLGAKLITLNFESKRILYDDVAVEAINQVIDEEKPDYIFTQWMFDTHQDHRNTSLATVSAGRHYENIFLYEPFPPSGRSYVGFKPQVYVDITDAIEKKIQALKCHASEVKKYGTHFLGSVTGRAQLRGYECGVEYAEAFELLRFKLQL
jgi:LmbE family N-acetylglucosaminyl deacetylase